MKKIIALLVIFAMVSTVVPGVAALDHFNRPGEYVDHQPYVDPYRLPEVNTQVHITLGGGGDPGDPPADPWDYAIVKCKWELAEHSGSPGVLVDDDLTVAPTQIAPEPCGTVKVHFFAVVLEGIGTIEQVFADVWHPDGTFKYEVPLYKIDCKEEALALWDLIADNQCIIMYNEIDGYVFDWADVNHELEQYTECFLYHGEAELSYCQPAGWYTAGVTARDSMKGWGQTLWNWFWYIPVTAVNKDFTFVDYGDTITHKWEWANGDRDMTTDGMPTLRNVGNVPVGIFVCQDDMDFGYDNVMYDARVGDHTLEGFPDPDAYIYAPDPNYPSDFTFIGYLQLCTKDKVDFSIHVTKSWVEEEAYTGVMTLEARRYEEPPYSVTYEYFLGDQEPGMPVPPNFNPIDLGPTPPPNDPPVLYPAFPMPFPLPAIPGTSTEHYNH